MSRLPLHKFIYTVLAWVFLSSFALAQGWDYVDSARFSLLDGSTVEITGYRNVFNGLSRVALERTGGRARGVERASMVLSPKEVDFFAATARGMIGELGTPHRGNEHSLTIARKYGQRLGIGSVSNHEGAFIHVSITKDQNQQDGVGTAIGFDEGDYSKFLRVLDSLNRPRR